MLKSNINSEDLVAHCVFPNSFIRNGKISPQQKILFEIMCSYDFLDECGQRKGWCDPSLDTIRKQMGYEEKRSVQTHLKKLVQLGLVTVIYRDISQLKKSSIYILNILPGVDEHDKEKIAATRNIDIKNIISGLNTIKVQTTEGIKYISKEEFDLEYLITGTRSSTIISGNIVEDVSLINEEKEDQFSDISFGPSKTNKSDIHNKGFKSSNLNERIEAGNYTEVLPKDVINYFKYLFEKKYSPEIYMLGRNQQKDISIIRKNIETYSLEVFINMLEYFIENYDKMFYNIEHPRPRVNQLSIPWILNSISAKYNKDIKINEEFNQVNSNSSPVIDQKLF